MIILNPSCGMSEHARGGGERYESDVVSGLAAKGHDVQVLWFPFQGAGRWQWSWAWMAPQILAAWHYEKFDILRCHSAMYLGPACVMAKKLGVKAPLVVHVHHLEPIVARLERWVLLHADRIIVDSPFVAQQLFDFLPAWTHDKIRVVFCGVPEPPRYPTGLKVIDFPSALTIGPVIERKKPLLMVREWSKTQKGTLIWIGEGPMLEQARRLANELGSRVIFPGGVPESYKNHLLYLVDLFVFMSTLEGCPLAILEAMAVGLPVVALRGGPIEGILGALQSRPLTDWVRGVDAMMHTPDLRRSMGHHNRRLWEERHTPQVFIQQIEEAYEQV
jgi:glycosyltransferase involved in cell wall biosynthesis